MEKIKLTREQFQNKEFDGVKFIEVIPYAEQEDYAFEYVSKTLVLDECGIAYTNYKEPVVSFFLYIKYGTNLDVSEYDTVDGWAFIFDCMNEWASRTETTHPVWMMNAQVIASLLRDATMRRYEQLTSLSHVVAEALPHLVDGTAGGDAKVTGEQLIELREAMNQKNNMVNLSAFAKKK